MEAAIRDSVVRDPEAKRNTLFQEQAMTKIKLVPHDGVSECFVCRNCAVQIDPVGGYYPRWTDAQCDAGECPLCGGTDTAWLFASYAAERQRRRAAAR